MKTQPAVVAFLLVVPLSLLPSPCRACGHDSHSLSELAERAELIVVGRVDRIEWDPTATQLASPFAQREIAVIQVIDTWKGPSMREVSIDFPNGAASVYAVDAVVVAFAEHGETVLRRLRQEVEAASLAVAPEADAEDEKSGKEIRQVHEDSRHALRQVDGRSDGRWIGMGVPREFRAPNERDRSDLKSLIETAAHPGEGEHPSEADRRAWLIAATRLRITRPSALSELSMDELTREELADLAGVFISRPAFDETDGAMLELLARFPDPDVDLAAVALVEAGLEMADPPDWLEHVLFATLLRYDPDLSEKVRRSELPSWALPVLAVNEDPPLSTVWNAARIGLDIPRVAPAEAPAEEEQP